MFIDDMTEDRSSRMNSEVYRNILSAHIQPNSAKLIGRGFKIQMYNDPKHTVKATQEFFKAKKWNILQWPSQSPDLNPIEHAFHLLKTRLKAERPANKQKLKTAAVKALLQFLNLSSNFDVNTLKLKLKVCTSSASQLFHFKSIVVAYRAKIMKITVQIFLDLTVSSLISPHG